MLLFICIWIEIIYHINYLNKLFKNMKLIILS